MAQTLYLAANLVRETAVFGHLQIVYEDVNGDLLENETTSPGFPYFFGDWVYPTFGRPHDVAENTPGYGSPNDYAIVPLDLQTSQTGEHVWELLGQIHASLSNGRHGLNYDVDQNSNSYATTILWSVGIDIGPYLSEVTPPDVLGFPGVETNILLGAATGGFFSSDDTPIPLTLAGTAGNDFIRTGIGDDTLGGGGGNDQILSGDGADEVTGGGGADTLLGEGGNDALSGDEGYDMLRGGGGFDLLRGGDGNDALYGGGQGDILYGEVGSDLLIGENGYDRLFGGFGSDTLQGGAGSDMLLGGDQPDVLLGGTGSDSLEGGSGSDQLFGEAGSDTLIGGNGNDTLHGGDQSDELFGGAHHDLLEGGNGYDRLHGERGSDTLSGGNGDDLLEGGHGSDSLLGGAGSDTLHGGKGHDTMSGGLDADTFVFKDFDSGFGHDTITDFKASAPREVIDLKAVASIQNFSDLVDNHMSQVDEDVVIDALGGSTVTLLGVFLSDLSADDFLF